jgi:phage tail sheath protein FI
LPGVAAGESFLPDAVRGFFDNGGAWCYVAAAPRAAADREAALAGALATITGLTDTDLVAMPDAMLLRAAGGGIDTDAAIRSQQRVLTHCAMSGTRFAILDALPAASPSMVTTQRQRLASGLAEPLNGALYYPWLKGSAGRLTPPSGHAAGIFASAGVYRAPAGQALNGVLDLELGISDAVQAGLNAAGINCLRAFAGRGIRVWGARTISTDPAWRYINVRRLFLTLTRWIHTNLAWTEFESNTPATWARIERALRTWLITLWRGGALQGDSEDQAFYVKCDSVTNPLAARDTGVMTVEIGLAPSNPAEFVVVRLNLQPDAPA